LDDWIYWHFFTIANNYSSSQSVTVSDSLHSLLDCECLLFRCDWLGSDLRVGHFFSFRCSLVKTPQLNTELLTNALRTESLNSLELNWSLEWRLTYDWIILKVKVMLRPTSLSWNKAPIWGLRPDLFWQLRICWFGAPSLTSGRIGRLQLLLVLASAVIFWSESRRTRGQILLSQIRDFPFRRLLRLAGSRWRYSTPPPYGLLNRSLYSLI
jgi:hypothetical protein